MPPSGTNRRRRCQGPTGIVHFALVTSWQNETGDPWEAKAVEAVHPIGEVWPTQLEHGKRLAPFWWCCLAGERERFPGRPHRNHRNLLLRRWLAWE